MAVYVDHFEAKVIRRPIGIVDPKETFTNTFHFRDDTGLLNEAPGEILSRLTTFYGAIKDYLGGWLDPTVEVNVYDLGVPEGQRVPISLSFELAAPVDNRANLPRECAVKITTRAASAPMTVPAEPLPGKKRAKARRRTGGCYIGPLNAKVLANLDIAAAPVLFSGVSDAIAAACAGLASVSVADPVQWVLLSPTLEETFVITDGFVDRDFDTVRSRGIPDAARSVWSV